MQGETERNESWFREKNFRSFPVFETTCNTTSLNMKFKKESRH
jgi:hypothetical protein